MIYVSSRKSRALLLFAASLSIGLMGCSAGKPEIQSLQSINASSSHSALPPASSTDSRENGGTESSEGSGQSYRSSADIRPCAASDVEAKLNSPKPSPQSMVDVELVVKNIRPIPCTLRGTPTLFFVQGRGGGRLGAFSHPFLEAQPDDLITLTAGSSAQAHVTIDQGSVQNAASRCYPQTAAGLHIILPGLTKPIFLMTIDYIACTNPDITTLTVSPFISEH